ncbi:MAG TPA: carboxymuconolactone decarboxylase family protein [Trebonia sp.]|jgi:AhpD family alkylhydroperoxidase|nr:carboxymuconolactone decarboxylase family protein [Trebonia sp.]
MTGKTIRKVLGQLGLTQVRHVKPVRIGAGPPSVSRIYEQVEREFGVLAPPMALHSPAPEVLAANWVMLRETLIVSGRVGRAVKEAVSTTVSAGNACPFCVTVHSSTLSGLADARGRTGDTARAVIDPRVRAAVTWAEDSRTEEGALRHKPPWPAGEAAEVIGTAVDLHYLNRMVNIFLGEVPLPPGVPRPALGFVMRILGGMIQTAARQPHPPGASLDLLPPAQPPGDLAWAAGDPVVTDAFARACAVIDAAAARSVPPAVRDTVLTELAGWRGETRGPSRAWVEAAVYGLPKAHRAAGRLALLTAIASYQVDRSVIQEFRLGQPADSALIELTSWASLAAARRVGAWIPVPGHTAPATARK